jgi:hypothetical protein
MGLRSTNINTGLSRFSERVLQLLDKVEHRRARTRGEFDAVYRLRREVASRRGFDPYAEGRFDAALDNAPGTWITTTFIDGELISTLRIHLTIGENDRLHSLPLYSDIIKPHLQNGRTIIDASRLATRLEYSLRFPEIPYVALRPSWLAAEYFDADFIVAMVSEEQQPFYRRVFGYEPWCEPLCHPYHNGEACCMGLDFRALKERVESNYPVFRSSKTERDALFRRRETARPVLAFG